jgi:DNA-3-methyladenine glycosylase
VVSYSAVLAGRATVKGSLHAPIMKGAPLVVLPREMFAGSATAVAPTLLGCVLEHETPDGLVAVVLTEVEAYMGAADPASHAYRGRTARNGVMFGPPGYAYVYFTYGMHFCVNLVCQPPGTASAVLLRAGRVIAGVELATARRAAGRDRAAREQAGREQAGREQAGREQAGREQAGREQAGRKLAERDLARGPGRLCKALDITRAQDGADVCDPASPLRVRWPDRRETLDISQGPRVGISVATEVPWRFWVTGDPTVSVYRPYAPRQRRKPVSAQQRGDGTIPG